MNNNFFLCTKIEEGNFFIHQIPNHHKVKEFKISDLWMNYVYMIMFHPQILLF